MRERRQNEEKGGEKNLLSRALIKRPAYGILLSLRMGWLPERGILYIDGFLCERTPSVRLVEPDGTYLGWLDFRALGLPDRELDELMLDKADEAGFLILTGPKNRERVYAQIKQCGFVYVAV